MRVINWDSIDSRARTVLLQRPACFSGCRESVQKIIEFVQAGGDQALMDLTKKYDGCALQPIKVTDDELSDAEAALSSTDKKAIEKAISRISAYQASLLPKQSVHSDGYVCTTRLQRAINRVGLYVPGGTAPLVSTVMMLAIPAKIAGCTERVICTPPNREGNVSPYILATAKRCGITDIFKVGGAQAIAALGYGTETIQRVDKIFGPGNGWVTQAKQLVAQGLSGTSIDMPAGPSEILIIADGSVPAEFVAADLLSQAEHGADSQALLVTTNSDYAKLTIRCVAQQLKLLNRAAITQKSLENCHVIVVASMQDALTISNDYAPEHLSLQVENPKQLLDGVNNAGAVFLGKWSAETMGDYINGSNHVLPTGGYANSISGLSVSDFMKQISVQEVSRDGLLGLGEDAMALASIEGLDAHRMAVELRLNAIREGVLL